MNYYGSRYQLNPNVDLIDKKRIKIFIDSFEKRFDEKIDFLGRIKKFHCYFDEILFKTYIDKKLYILQPSIRFEDRFEDYLNTFETYLQMFRDNEFKQFKEFKSFEDRNFKYFKDIKFWIERYYKNLTISFRGVKTYKKDINIYKSCLYDINYNNNKITLERKCNEDTPETIYAWLDIMIEETIKNKHKYNYNADIIKNQVNIFDFIQY